MPNRNMQAKHNKAASQRATFCSQIMTKDAANNVPMSDQVALVSALASDEQVVSVGGVMVSRHQTGHKTIKGYSMNNPANVTRRTIAEIHW